MFPPTIINSTQSHLSLLSHQQILVFINKKGKTTFPSNQVVSKKETSPWLNTIFFSLTILQWNLRGCLHCVCDICASIYGCASLYPHEDPLPYFLETGPLIEPEARLASSKSLQSSCPHSPQNWSYRYTQPCFTLDMRAGNLNSSSHAHTASDLTC